MIKEWCHYMKRVTAKTVLFLSILMLTLVFVSMEHSLTKAEGKKGSDSKKDTPYALISILNATYGDHDADGNEDDVLAILKHEFHGKPSKDYYVLDVFVTLVLPSGNYMMWEYIIYSQLQSVTLRLHFYNHATEQGNYRLMVDAFLFDNKIAYTWTDHVFDPPGGRGDNPPNFAIEFA